MHKLPKNFLDSIYNHYDEFIILETSKVSHSNFHSYIFINPLKKILLNSLSETEIKKFFRTIEILLNKKFCLSGFFSYELGYGLDFNIKKIKKQKKFDIPLAYFWVCKSPIIFNHKTGKFSKNLHFLLKNKNTIPTYFQTRNFHLNTSFEEYKKNIKKIKKYIANGDTYQVNYTIKGKFNFIGSEISLYHSLKENQQVEYGAFIKDRNFSIISFSPELFFKIDKNIITVKPMKGTIERNINKIIDKKNRFFLTNSEKNRAENLMIVDLLRNDLGKISVSNTVKVNKLFQIEKYKTLYQMTSTITSKLKNKVNLYQIFKSIFPSGSVTGAPKIRTMEIIQNLEKESRNIYTGVIGLFLNKKHSIFNVAIRTILLRKGTGEIGIGSGILYTSNYRKEYNECLLKSKFFTSTTHQQPPFCLIETMLWKKNLHPNKISKHGFFLLKYHLDRIEHSAKYFGFKFDKQKLTRQLLYLTEKFNRDKYKIRVLLYSNGKIEITLKEVEELPCQPVKITVSNITINNKNIFLYHKTTNRKIYEEEYKKYKSYGYFDVLFRNQNNQFTETSRGNIFLKINGKLTTPPIECGLLPGTYRKFLIENSSVIIKPIYEEDLQKAEKIFITNSVVGLVEGKIFL